MRVTVLGGGLSAAYAYRACLDYGVTPDVYTDRVYVPPGGFIYAHRLPKSVNKYALWESIDIKSEGDAGGYAAKMWGRRDVRTSFHSAPRRVSGASPLKAARALWGDRKALASSLHLGALGPEEILALRSQSDVAIQTFSTGTTDFHTPIWVAPWRARKPNVVMYEGSERVFYTRACSLFGFDSFEFPPVPIDTESYLARDVGPRLGIIMEIARAKLWYAPELQPPELREGPRIATERDGNTLYCGRWATGLRTFLSHEAYQLTLDFLKEKLGGPQDGRPVPGNLEEPIELQPELGAPVPGEEQPRPLD